jgi:PucR-like helix-turn-helix protein
MIDAGTAQPHTDRDALFEALLADRDGILAEMVKRAREELSAYGDVGADSLLPGFDLQFETVLRCARTGRALEEDDHKPLAEIGETRALAGIPIEEMLRAWRIGIQVVIDQTAEIAARENVDPAATLAFVRAIFTWADVAMVTTATAHRNAEIELARRDEERRATLVRGLLFGTLPMGEIRDQIRAYGFDTTRTYVAVHAQQSPGSTHRDLDAALGFLDATMHRPGLRVTLDGDLAGFLRDRPPGEIPGTVGVGPPRTLDELADSFRLATRAFRCALRFGLTGVYTIDDLGLLPSIADDRDVGEALCRRYLEPLGDGSSAAELRATLRAHFECSMNVDRAAERLYVHPNTVRYRISRFEEITGARLRDARTAFEVWWALDHAAMRSAAPPPSIWPVSSGG